MLIRTLGIVHTGHDAADPLVVFTAPPHRSRSPLLPSNGNVMLQLTQSTIGSIAKVRRDGKNVTLQL